MRRLFLLLVVDYCLNRIMSKVEKAETCKVDCSCKRKSSKDKYAPRLDIHSAACQCEDCMQEK